MVSKKVLIAVAVVAVLAVVWWFTQVRPLEGKVSCSVPGKPRIFFFTDPYCPACAQTEPSIDAFEQKFGSVTEIIFKTLVTHSAGLMQNTAYGQERVLAAHGYFLCAQDQGKLFEFRKLFYSNLKVSETPLGSDFVPFTQAELSALASQAGLDAFALSTCLPTTKQRILADEGDAKVYGVQGTPSMVLDCLYLDHASKAEELLCSKFPATAGCEKK